MEKKTNTPQEKMKKNKDASVQCEERCNIHGTLSVRGRKFEGTVKKIVGQRAVLEMERIVYYTKYQLYSRTKGKMHAHIPKCMVASIKVGDYVEAGECRPLSKITNFVVLGKIR